MRTSLRTPGILIFGLVLSPCGWVLDLTATVAPNWRTLHNLPNTPVDTFLQQGIWDICRATSTESRAECGLQDTTYFNHEIIPVAQGLMVASLVVTIIGLIVAIPGVRCWRDNPNWTVAGLGGLLIFISGVFTIIPISWYTHLINEIPSSSPLTDVHNVAGPVCRSTAGLAAWLDQHPKQGAAVANNRPSVAPVPTNHCRRQQQNPITLVLVPGPDEGLLRPWADEQQPS
uniref:Claudin 23.1 n=1 Tax=Takifugu rubripes TaxID=31033 RepID=H2TS82_TAKRU